MKEQIKPGFFGRTVFADGKRVEFDSRNGQILHSRKCPDIVFFGDSITQHWELELYFNPTVLKINRGIGNDTTVYGAKRFVADVLQFDPKAVVILMGINDLLTMAPDLWKRTKGAEPDKVISEIESNFRNMLSKCGGIKIYLCSVLPQSLCPPYDREFFDRNIVRTNEMLKSLCKEFGAEYVDYYGAMAQDGLLPDAYTYDGVHPNAQGYEIMANVLKGKVGIL